MKHIPVLLALLLCNSTLAQVSDDFSDGDFSANPVWTGNSSDFTINPAKQLQLNNTVAGTSYLVCASNMNTVDDMQWNCYVKQSFAPSANNYGRLYLVSDQANLQGPLNGYFLQFGEAGSNDAIELFKQSGSSISSVCRGTNAEIASSFVVAVKVIRNAAGVWTLYTDLNAGTNYTIEATGTDLAYNTSLYMGVSTVYTSSNASKFYYDDFYAGPVVTDTVPPAILTTTVISSTQLDVLFDEAPDLNSSQNTANYTVNNGINAPSSAIRDLVNSNLVHLTFATAFSNGMQNLLTVNGVEDISGNMMSASTHIFSWYLPETNDLVINEIMFDPFPDGVEWIELYNRSNKTIDLAALFTGKYDTIQNKPVHTATIIAAAYLLFPGEYVVLSESADKIKSQYSCQNPKGFVDVPDLPALYSEDAISISDVHGTTIDCVKYSDKMHFPLLNITKGVSLERIDYNRPGNDKTNWNSASAPAGFATPGYRNSQYLQSDGETNVYVSPEIFSPDNDGYNDEAGITYTFNEAGKTANIIIYDSYGRFVKHLVKNELIGTTGTYSWNGTTEKNEKAPLGIYIIYIEVFDAPGRLSQYKLSTVLGGKL